MAMFLLGGPSVHAVHEPNNIPGSAKIRLETLAGGATVAGGFNQGTGLSLASSLWIIAGAAAAGSVIDIIGASREFAVTPGVAWSHQNPVLTISTTMEF